MARQIVTIPRALMRQLEVNWRVDARGQGLPETTTGLSQTVYNAFPRWVGSPRLSLRRDTALQWRAIKSRLRGRVNVLRVPMIDPLGFDWIAAAGAQAAGVNFSTGQPFSTGAGFEYTPVATAAQAYAVGATSIRIDISPTGIAPVVGQIMSWWDWPFAVESAVQVSATLWDLEIWLPLRAALPSGGLIRMEGVGLFEAPSDDMGDLAYDANQKAVVQTAFREWIHNR